MKSAWMSWRTIKQNINILHDSFIDTVVEICRLECKSQGDKLMMDIIADRLRKESDK